MSSHGRVFFGAASVLAVASTFALSGCGAAGSASPNVPPQAAPAALDRSFGSVRSSAEIPPATYKQLHEFVGGADGASPGARLIDVGGTLYGTTFFGAGTGCGGNGCGTVFKITTGGAESVVYGFQGGPSDGTYAEGGVIDVGGTLYGTTAGGGTTFNGTVYKLTTTGTESILHNFAGSPDGASPIAEMIDAGGVLYGTTEQGGSGVACNGGCGTVFTINASGTESVLHSFKGGSDGDDPRGGLISVGGTLYGTTDQANTTCSVGCGTVFKLTKAGRETVLHRFAGGSDGAYPSAGLIDVNGTLYGTTTSGGSSNNGTVFKITTSGTEGVIYSFAGGGDGAHPYASLIDVGGVLYGSTHDGGGAGLGTVFKITTAGAETVMHAFMAGPSDGIWPTAALVNVNGRLYGTTSSGGTNGGGIVFSIHS